MQIIVKHVASAHKDWDTYLPSAMNAYNTSLSETTDDTSFFLTYCCKPVKIPDVALLPPMVAKMSRLSLRTINLTNEDSKTIGYWVYPASAAMYEAIKINMQRIILSE